MKRSVLLPLSVALVSLTAGVLLLHHTLTGEWLITPEDLYFWEWGDATTASSTQRWDFAIRDSITIQINSSDVDIQIAQGDGDSLSVELWRLGETTDDDNYYTSVRRVDSTTFSISALATAAWQQWKEGHARMMISAPRHTELTITSLRGNLIVTNIDGRLSLQSRGGNIVVAGGAGALTAGASGGSVRVDQHDGHETIIGSTVKTSSTSGQLFISTLKDIEIGSHHGTVTANSERGPISAELIDPDSTSSLSSTVGSIHLRVGIDASVIIDAVTQLGSVYSTLRSGMTMSNDSTSGHFLHSLNDATTLVTLRTSEGNITVDEY